MLLCFDVMSDVLERVLNPTPILFYYADIHDLGVGRWVHSFPQVPLSSSCLNLFTMPTVSVVPFLESPSESEKKF